MLQVIAIEGIDGTGKTTVARELAELLKQQGINTAVCAPFRLANEKIGEDTYVYWRQEDTAKLAIGAIHAVLENCEEEAARDGVEVLVYDRHWMTVHAEIHDRPALQEAWGDCFVPTALLQVDPAIATQRTGSHPDEPWSQLTEQQKYTAIYETLAIKHARHILGAYRNDGASAADTARAIATDMNLIGEKS